MKEHKAEINKLNTKLKMIQARRDELDKENKKLQVNKLELQEQCNKLMLEKDELQKALKNRTERLDIEMSQKEKAMIQLNNMQSSNRIGTGFGGSGALTYDQLAAKVKELEQDIIILNCS